MKTLTNANQNRFPFTSENPRLILYHITVARFIKDCIQPFRMRLTFEIDPLTKSKEHLCESFFMLHNHSNPNTKSVSVFVMGNINLNGLKITKPINEARVIRHPIKTNTRVGL